MQTLLKKSLGQNFLKDAEAAERIADGWGDLSTFDVLEVGPGDGRLTRHLLKRAKRVIAVEIDKRWADQLWRTFEGHPGFVLRHDDVTKIQWEREVNKPFVLFGNLPYHLSSSILFGAIEYIRRRQTDPSLPQLLGMVVMLQKEVALRAASEPGSSEYGLLSSFLQLYGTTEVLFHLPPSAFVPAPKVYSSVLKVTFDKLDVAIDNWLLFNSIVRAGYAGRRKMLRNTLPAIRPPLPAGFLDLNFDYSRRPQTLSPVEWVALANELSAMGKWSPVQKKKKEKPYKLVTNGDSDEMLDEEDDSPLT